MSWDWDPTSFIERFDADKTTTKQNKTKQKYAKLSYISYSIHSAAHQFPIVQTVPAEASHTTFSSSGPH